MHVGRSRFSRCCHLIIALQFRSLKNGTWARRYTQSPELGLGFCLSLPGERSLFLCGCCNCNSTAVVQWLVHFSTEPQVMQQHCQLSCGRNDGSLLAASSPRSATSVPCAADHSRGRTVPGCVALLVPVTCAGSLRPPEVVLSLRRAPRGNLTLKGRLDPHIFCWL